MKHTVLRWLVGIGLVGSMVTARHILNGEENTPQGRSGRDQYHAQPFYGQSPHLSYNSFRSSMRRTPPQSPHRRNLVEQDPSSANSQNEQDYATNYFFSNDQPLHPYNRNQQNLNVYSAVRLHGALEARARAEPGSPTLLSKNHPYGNFNHPPQFSQVKPERHWRRDDEHVDGESDEGGFHDDLARFSLYNSYFDNEHSIKALNSMRCVTPTGSQGFCSTFRGCVPSFFTNDGQLEAPALAELISTSIGYCTTNVSHHFIREQRQQQFSREERRFNSVANRIICCPGVAPVRDPNQDPDKIFNDYLEAQKNRLKSTTTTTTTTSTTLPPPSSEAPQEQGSEIANDGPAQTEGGLESETHPDTVKEPEMSKPSATESAPGVQEPELQEPVSDSPSITQESQSVNAVVPGESDSSNSMNYPTSQAPEISSTVPEGSQDQPGENPSGDGDGQVGIASTEDSNASSMYPSSQPPIDETASGSASENQSQSNVPGQDSSAQGISNVDASEQAPVSEGSSISSESPVSPVQAPETSTMYPSEPQPETSSPESVSGQQQGQSPDAASQINVPSADSPSSGISSVDASEQAPISEGPSSNSESQSPGSSTMYPSESQPVTSPPESASEHLQGQSSDASSQINVPSADSPSSGISSVDTSEQVPVSEISSSQSPPTQPIDQQPETSPENASEHQQGQAPDAVPEVNVPSADSPSSGVSSSPESVSEQQQGQISDAASQINVPSADSPSSGISSVDASEQVPVSEASPINPESQSTAQPSDQQSVTSSPVSAPDSEHQHDHPSISVDDSEQAPAISEGSSMNHESQSPQGGSTMYPDGQAPSISPSEPDNELTSATVQPVSDSQVAPVADQVSDSNSPVELNTELPPNVSSPESSSSLPDSEVLPGAISPSGETSSDSSGVVNESSSASPLEPTESESSPAQPSQDEAELPPKNPGIPGFSPVSSDQEPVNEQTSTDASSSSSLSPGIQEPQSPGKSTDSPIFQIKPDPVTGANGKFTLPGGLYIVSSSTDHPHSNQNQVRPSPGGTETMVDSMPIIIVTNPGAVIDMMPHFPSDFPSMGQDPIPPVDDSSLELQRPRPSQQPTPSTESTVVPSELPPSESVAISQDTPQTTIPPSQPIDVAQEDESSLATTAQSPNQNEASHSDDVTTSRPLSDDGDDDENDALTILPVSASPTPKTGSSSTTEMPQVSGDNMALTTIKSSGQTGSDLDITTVSSIQSVGSQEVEVTTTRQQGPSSSNEPSISAVSGGSSQENVETTPNYIAATTVPTESDESDESSEEVRATPSDDQKTTLAPSAGDEDENDLAAARTTTMSPIASGVNHDEEDDQEDESAPTMPPSSSSDILAHPDQQEGTTQNTVSSDLPSHAVQSENEIVPSETGSHDQISETQQPFPASSPAPSGDEEPEQQQQLFPDSQQQQQQQQQPFPGESEATTVGAASISSDDQHEPIAESGSEGQFTIPETSTTSQVPSESNVGGIAGLSTTTGSPDVIPGEQQASSGSESSASGGSTGNEQPSGDDNGEGTVDESSSVSTGNESSGSTSESSSVPGNEPSAVLGSLPSGSGNDPSVSGDDSSSNTPASIISSSSSPGSESLVSAQSDDNNSPSTESANSASTGGEASPISEGENSSSTSESPEAIPSHDAESSSNLPSDNDSDSKLSHSESPLPPSSSASTDASESKPEPESASGAPSTSGISEENVTQLPSESPENASTVQGSSQQTNSPVSSDSMQNSEVGFQATEAPQNVPVEESSPANEEISSTAASLEPVPPPEELQPNYQILKACKFQSYFRSVDDMSYSYRHYPWLATIVGGTRPFSSGTLITDRHILTASHFLSNITVSDVFNMRIHIGYRTSYSGQTEGPYAVRKVRKVIRHKGFSFEKLYNDIAVLVLDRPVRFSEDIYPVCISSNSKAYADGTAEAFETGWIEDPRTYTISQHHNYLDPHIQKYFSFGYKNITWRLQEAPQRVRTNQECQSNYGFLEKNGIMVTDSMVCAGSGDTRSCAFRGNSGAPLFMRNENEKMTEQIGVVSWGIGCGHFPFVFTRVEAFLPWLDRVVYNSR